MRYMHENPVFDYSVSRKISAAGSAPDPGIAAFGGYLGSSTPKGYDNHVTDPRALRPGVTYRFSHMYASKELIEISSVFHT